MFSSVQNHVVGSNVIADLLLYCCKLDHVVGLNLCYRIYDCVVRLAHIACRAATGGCNARRRL